MAILAEVAVGDIKPDPNQPRTHIDQDKVRDMAQSMRTEGVIKPIEIDEDNVIVTGEMRWRAAKEAGLATIPCVRRSFKGRDRYRRQLIENLHNNTMSSMETAKALDKLLDKSLPLRLSRGKLAKEVGASVEFVREHLAILDLTAAMQKKISDNELPRTIIRAIRLVPEEHRQAFEKKVLDENLGRDISVKLSQSLHYHPYMAEELLAMDFKGKTTREVAKILELEAPALSQHIQRNNETEKSLHKHITAIIKWMAENDLDEVGPIYQEMIKSDFRVLSRHVSGWAKRQNLIGPEEDIKKIEKK